MNEQRQNPAGDEHTLIPSRHGTPDERPRRSYLPLDRRKSGLRTYLGAEHRTRQRSDRQSIPGTKGPEQQGDDD